MLHKRINYAGKGITAAIASGALPCDPRSEGISTDDGYWPRWGDGEASPDDLYEHVEQAVERSVA